MQFLHHVAHQAAPTHQVTSKLLGELLEARLALGAGSLLVRFENRRAGREVIADEQRERFDGDALVTLHALGLTARASVVGRSPEAFGGSGGAAAYWPPASTGGGSTRRLKLASA